MLVEAMIQLVGPMLLELAIREVAVPAAKKLAHQDAMNQTAEPLDAVDRDKGGLVPMFSTVPAVRVVSAIPGRVRVDVAGLGGRPDVAQRLNDEIRALGGVTQAEASARTGRMLVTFAPELQSIETLIAAIDRARSASIRSGAVRTRQLAAVV